MKHLIAKHFFGFTTEGCSFQLVAFFEGDSDTQFRFSAAKRRLTEAVNLTLTRSGIFRGPRGQVRPKGCIAQITGWPEGAATSDVTMYARGNASLEFAGLGRRSPLQFNATIA